MNLDMETPPPDGLSLQVVAGALADFWGLEMQRLDYLPKGFGSYHWLGAVAEGKKYFVTVDDLDGKPWLGRDPDSTFEGLQAAYGTSSRLHDDAHLDFVVAPILGPGGMPACRVSERYSVAVYPFIDGHAGEWGESVSPENRDQLLQCLAELHSSTATVTNRAPRADLDFPGRAGLETALDELDRPWTGGPFSEDARTKLAVRTPVLREWLESFDDLMARVRTATVDPVITHGEPHPENLIRRGTQLLFIDWDTVALARPERDLWMLDDGAAGLATYVEATGRTVNPTAIELYRLSWTLEDVAAFIALFRSEHSSNLGTEKKWRALADTLDGVPLQPYGPVQETPAG